VSIDKTNGVSRITSYLEVSVDLDKPIVAQLNLKHFTNGAYVKSFMNIDVEACSFFKATSSNPIAMKVFDYVRQFGKIATRCPIKKVAKYVVFKHL
jgi:hypothetical protein